MQPLTSKKWNRMLMFGLLFFGIILVVEVLPLTVSTADIIWQYLSATRHAPDEEIMKQNFSLELSRKKQLSAERKSLFSASLHISSNTRLIEMIDSLGRTNGCKLISVQPLEGKDGKGGTSVQFSFRTGYLQLCNMIHGLGRLPFLFTIRELRCSENTDTNGELTAVLLLSLLNGSNGGTQ